MKVYTSSHEMSKIVKACPRLSQTKKNPQTLNSTYKESVCVRYDQSGKIGGAITFGTEHFFLHLEAHLTLAY